jgi:general secretion pathway protein N
MARLPARDRSAPDAPKVTRKIGGLVALGLFAVILFALATLPATLFAGYLQRHGVTALAYSGSVWSGAAAGLGWRGAALGDLRWKLAPLALLRGRLAADVQLTRPDGSLTGRLAATMGGAVNLANVHLDLPVEALNTLPVGLPKGWRGRVQADLVSLHLEAGWPTTARGTIEMDNLIAPPPRNASIGSYRAVLPDPKAAAGAASGITARVSDKSGPLVVDAQLTLSPDRSFLLDGTLAPRGDTPPELRRSLEILGPADAAGRRPFSVSGTL